jgi:hypothetical protein
VTDRSAENEKVAERSEGKKLANATGNGQAYSVHMDKTLPLFPIILMRSWLPNTSLLHAGHLPLDEDELSRRALNPSSERSSSLSIFILLLGVD